MSTFSADISEDRGFYYRGYIYLLSLIRNELSRLAKRQSIIQAFERLRQKSCNFKTASWVCIKSVTYQ